MDENKSFVNVLISGLEKKHNIKVLFAVDAGYRRFGLASAKHDYDIKFVYINNKSAYKERINDENYNILFNLEGYNLSYVLDKLKSNDYELVELVNSSMIYFCDDNFNEIKKVIFDTVNPQRFEKYLLDKVSLNIKKYFSKQHTIKVKDYVSIVGDFLTIKYCKEKNKIQKNIFYNIDGLSLKLTRFMDIVYLMDTFSKVDPSQEMPFIESLNKMIINGVRNYSKSLEKENLTPIDCDIITSLYETITSLYQTKNRC